MSESLRRCVDFYTDISTSRKGWFRGRERWQRFSPLSVCSRSRGRQKPTTSSRTTAPCTGSTIYRVACDSPRKSSRRNTRPSAPSRRFTAAWEDTGASNGQWKISGRFFLLPSSPRPPGDSHFDESSLISHPESPVELAILLVVGSFGFFVGGLLPVHFDG